jgi:hypothetical protein
LLLAAATAALAAAPFWLGPSFAGHPLVAHTESDVFVYGNCEIPEGQDEGGCSPPLQLQDRTTCERNVVALDVVPRSIYRLRGGGIAADYGEASIDVGSDHTTTTVFANSDRFARRATKAMRRRGQRRPHALPAPVYPPAVLKELKRVVVASHTPRSLEEIAHALGLGPGAVRARVRLARLLPPGTLRDVPVPRRSWAQVEHDRQIAFAAQTHQAQQRFDLTRAQVRRAVRRARGLTGRC